MLLAPQPHLTSLRRDAKRSRIARSRRPAQPRRRHLRLEPLEDRRLLSSYYSTDVPKKIPDRGSITSTLNVPDAATIADINVTLNITHTNDADMDVYLRAPDGTRVELFTDVGGAGDNFNGTTLDDEAAAVITAGTAPFASSYRPEGAFSGLDGKSANGTWTLEVTDDANRNTGRLNSWSINVTLLLPTISIDAVRLAEGDSGTTAFVFTVTRSGNTSQSSSVDYATAPGTASVVVDYAATSGTLN